MIKAVIFDCFGVLTVDHWKEFLAKLPPEQSEVARGLMYEHDAGRMLESELIREVQQLTTKTPNGIEKLVNDENVKNTELIDYIRELKATYKIGLLSNIGSNWIRDNFLSQEEQALFDAIVLSYEVKMAKPDPAIFDLVAERLGVEPNECAIVDDSSGHCSAAGRQGMKIVVYDNFQQMKSELEPLLNS